ncbi:MAG: carbohydrate-binding module family 20 domain-containing protein, partial [Nitrospirota bacterium]
YVKLVKSLADKNTWDSYSIVRSRYARDDVEVTFVCDNGHTNWGQNVYVAGSINQLGNWNTGDSLKLEPTAYPRWSKTFSIPANTAFTWKCIKKDPVLWQPDPNNSHTTPQSGSSTATGSF